MVVCAVPDGNTDMHIASSSATCALMLQAYRPASSLALTQVYMGMAQGSVSRLTLSHPRGIDSLGVSSTQLSLAPFMLFWHAPRLITTYASGLVHGKGTALGDLPGRHVCVWLGCHHPLPLMCGTIKLVMPDVQVMRCIAAVRFDLWDAQACHNCHKTSKQP